MSLVINISGITGTGDFDIWICNSCEQNTTCQYVATISEDNYSFILPSKYENSNICIKIIDDTGCQICECFSTIT
jgi:hypothetical protein